MTREPKVGDLETLGDVHAGGESCARAVEGVTLEKFTRLRLKMFRKV